MTWVHDVDYLDCSLTPLMVARGNTRRHQATRAVLNYFIRLAVFGNTIQHDDKSPGSAHLENAVSVTRLFHLENDLKSYADSTTSF